jgi:hypothetical protein
MRKLTELLAAAGVHGCKTRDELRDKMLKAIEKIPELREHLQNPIIIDRFWPALAFYGIDDPEGVLRRYSTKKQRGAKRPAQPPAGPADRTCNEPLT